MSKELYLVTNFIHVATKNGNLEHFSTNDLGSYELVGYLTAERLACDHNMAIYSILELHTMANENIDLTLLAA